MASIQLLVPLASGDDDICSMKIEFLKTFPRRKDSKKKERTKRNRVTSLFTKRYETGTWLFFRWKQGMENICLGWISSCKSGKPLSLSVIVFVPRNRITRKVIVRLMISLTGTDIFVSLHFHHAIDLSLLKYTLTLLLDPLVLTFDEPRLYSCEESFFAEQVNIRIIKCR